MTSLNPLHTIERQIGEIIALHGGARRGDARAGDRAADEVGIPDPARGSAPIRISCPAVSASA